MRKRLLTILVSISIVAALVGCGSANAGLLDEAAAVRAYDPNDDTIYIVDPFVPLADSANSAQLRSMAQAALSIVNTKRAAAGLSELEWSIGLENAAQIRANECEEKFSHTRPNGSEYWTADGNLVYGENLAMGYNNAEDVVDAWIASPTHKQNLMDPSYLTCSIAIHEAGSGDNKTMLWAQEFGY